LLLSFVVSLTIAASVSAQAVRGIRAAEATPIVPRGSVMMLKLSAEKNGTGWPDTMTMSMRDGAQLTGIVAWVTTGEAPRVRQWTDDPRGLHIRSNHELGQQHEAPAGVPYLLVRVPHDAEGEMKLDRQTIRPVWLDVPAPVNEFTPMLERMHAPDRPDPDSPFEHWRWVLLAESFGMQGPSMESFDQAERLLAEHLASLWRIGLARLERIDPAVAAEARSLLTRTATDRGEPFAAWVADPSATGSLLTELVSRGQSDEMLAQFVQLWIDENDRITIWPEADYDTTLRLAVLRAGHANREDMTLRFPGASQSPLRVTIEPDVLMRVMASKPVLSSDPVPTVYGRQPVQGETIVINMPGREMEMPLRPRRYAAIPPGVFLAELGAPFSLAEVQTLRRIAVRPDQATLVSIRKLRGRWEVFVDCRRPPRDDVDTHAPRATELPERLRTFDALCGTEAITLVIGPEQVEGGPSAIVTVPENGWHRVYYGVQDGTLQVHTSSHGDRWHARIVLPDGWMPHPDLGPALLGFVRTHGDSMGIETGPNSSVPWRIEPGRVAIDLNKWDGAAGN